MGLIYAIDISTDGIVTILMTLTSTTPDRITRAASARNSSPKWPRRSGLDTRAPCKGIQ
ncbi:hypothetical protein [uncultured Roseobacter sp.]|uniref:hypothetical protein n=1 Tax=uncultured Roseobacter sp. TaxID=114847 RepID=UPI002621515C|nr:hypothetical protein [uncultured Roseobacter sp.]